MDVKCRKRHRGWKVNVRKDNDCISRFLTFLRGREIDAQTTERLKGVMMHAIRALRRDVGKGYHCGCAGSTGGTCTPVDDRSSASTPVPATAHLRVAVAATTVEAVAAVAVTTAAVTPPTEVTEPVLPTAVEAVAVTHTAVAAVAGKPVADKPVAVTPSTQITRRRYPPLRTGFISPFRMNQGGAVRGQGGNEGPALGKQGHARVVETTSRDSLAEELESRPLSDLVLNIVSTRLHMTPNPTQPATDDLQNALVLGFKEAHEIRKRKRQDGAYST